MDTKYVRKRVNAIFIAVILVASTFTVAGAFPFFTQQAEAQGLQLRISISERPQFENHFFGPMIVQVVVDDPGATDPDESTVGLLVQGFTVPRVHLTDGLWYHFFAEEDSFGLLLDVLTDGVSDRNIAVSEGAAANDPAFLADPTIGIRTFTIIDSPPGTASFVREITLARDAVFVEVGRDDIFPTLPDAFSPAGNINPDTEIADDGADEGEPATVEFDGVPTAGPVDDICSAAALTGGEGLTVIADGDVADTDDVTVEGNEECDWPYIRMNGIEELDIVPIRAGSASVDLIYDDFADSINNQIDRATDYPLQAEIIVSITDFMYNINPVEEDVVSFALNPATGNPDRVIYQPVRDFAADFVTANLLDLNVLFDLEFDERQVLDVSPVGAGDGLAALVFMEFFDDSAGALVILPGTFEFPNAKSVDDILADAVPAGSPDQPIISFIESDPNTSFFETIDERKGSRSDIFTLSNDKVVNFDYFDIVVTAAMTLHDGFTSVDREVYDSADRAVFTVTDPDQNLRSRVSEEPDGRQSNSFVKVGDPIPVGNNPTFDAFFARSPGLSLPSDPAPDNGDEFEGFDVIDSVVDVACPGGGGVSDTGNGILDGDELCDDDIAGINEANFVLVEDQSDIDLGDKLTGGPDGGLLCLDTNRDSGVGTAPGGVGGTGLDCELSSGAGLGTGTFFAADDDVEPALLPTFSSTVLGGTQKIGMEFSSDGIPSAPPVADPDCPAVVADCPDQFSGLIVETVITLADLNVFETFSATKGQIIDVGDTATNLAFPVDPFVAAVSAFDAPGGVITDGDIDSLGALADTTAVTVLFPKYNLVQVDLVRLDTGLEIDVVPPLVDESFEDIAVQIEVCDDDECIRQLVDFTPILNEDPACPVASDNEDADGTFCVELLGSSKSGIGSFRVVEFLGNNWDDDAFGSILDGDSDDLDGSPGPLTFSIVFIDDSDGEPVSVITDDVSHIAILDVIGIGVVIAPPALAEPTIADLIDDIELTAFSNLVYRLELDEEGSNSSIFTGRMDFFTASQLDSTGRVLQEIVVTGDPLKAMMPNRFIPPDRLAFGNTDVDIVDVFRDVSATFIYETRDGSIEWDRSSFSFGQDAFLTVIDEDLNRRPDATERLDVPLNGMFFFELGKERVAGGALGGDTDFDNGATSLLPFIDATFLETGPNTGTFVSQITIAVTLTVDRVGVATSVNTNVRDLEANYVDVRDRSSVKQEFDDITNIRTTLGDVVLDRAAYPPGALMFVEIHDNDFNQDVDIRESLDLAQLVIGKQPVTAGALVAFLGADNEGFTLGPIGAGDLPIAFGGAVYVDAGDLVTDPDFSTNVNPILEINIFQEGTGRLATLLPVGLIPAVGVFDATGALDQRFGTGVLVGGGFGILNILPILDRNGAAVTAAIETGPNTGIFEFEVQLPGPGFDAENFPKDLPDILTAGTFENPVIDANQPIQVTYFDPADESGETEDEEELSTILFNTSRLRTDKLEYGLGEPVDIILEEPDFNFDSRSIDEIVFTILDVITDKFDTEDNPTRNFSTVIDDVNEAASGDPRIQGLRTNLTVLRETGFNTGVFVVQIEELVEAFVDRGEDVEFIYRDFTPSGGEASIRVEYEFLVVEILPEIIFDKEEYTPFDEVIVSIISPDSNQDPDRIETIRPLISSSSASLGFQSFPETGPNTGIFEEDFDMTPDPATFPGELQTIREDGVTVEFRIDEDTVATKSVFINYHVGQVMFDKDSFRISDRGVLRVIDPDANTNPDTIDTIGGIFMRFWSTTDRGGLSVTLRETGDRTGIFEEIITFTPDEESTGTRLRVSEGDTITAKYTDRTLPAPASLDAAQIFTVEIEELFASALIGAIVPPLERAVASEPELVDQTGLPVTDVSVGGQALIQSEITNSQTKKQAFAYIVQIKDADGVTVSLSWVTGELPGKESLKAAQSWIPDVAGDFTVEIFVWQSVDNPVALSPVRTTTVSVR